jgi:hypothetical protein
MAGRQYLHVSGFGRQPQAGTDDWSCIKGIIAEVGRVEGNYRHIQNPAEPRLLYGENPQEVGEVATLLSMQARGKNGRRLRCDGVTLIAGVVTYPMPRADLAGSVVEKDIYELWRNKTVDWLVNGSGIAIRCIMEHTDEEYLNLHFFALPTLTADFCLNFDAVHPGRRARDAATARGCSPAAVQAAYQAAMAEWQDRFHRDVSAFFGHERFGPRRQRVARERHKAIRQVERESEKMRADLELEYKLARSPDEIDALAVQVNPNDLLAAAMAENMQLRRQLARKETIMREFGLVDPEEAPPPPSDQELPAVPAIPHAQVLAALDELETFPEPVPAAIMASSDAWAEYLTRQNAGVGKLRLNNSRSQEDPEPPDDDPLRPA